MKAEIEARFTDKIRTEFAHRFLVEPKSLKLLDGFENLVLEGVREGRPCILRLTHHTHRTRDKVEAELDWIDFLAGKGAPVCVPLRSREGNLTEYIETDADGFVAVLFEKAPGSMVERDQWTPAMTFNRGVMHGRMHRLTRDYQPPSETVRRWNWHEEHDFVAYRDYLPEGDEIIGDRFEELLDDLRSIPTDGDSYGLCHVDAHTGNIFFDGDRPTLFDFDDSAYDFFIADLAIALFYAVPKKGTEAEIRAFSREFLTRLLEGYRTEFGLDNKWREMIPKILRRRQMVLYVAIYRGFDSDGFDEFCRAYIDRNRSRIIDRTPFVDLDWTEFELS
ncbi:MAG TPA: phosphotransferase [candidate division Zixibacteria bacterium]|nr:phosphotransferase [candidate division Zixibacteria bacterium]